VAQTKKRLITAEDLYTFELISQARLSPDGQTVVYCLSRVDRKTEKKYSNLWVIPTNGGQQRQFTHGDQNDSSPRWSPDGSEIAFLSNRGDFEKPAQIYIIPLMGGEARKLADIKGEAGSLSWSPDGKRLLCTVRKTDAEVLERESDEQKKKLGVVARHYERVYYKLDGYGYLPKERTHVWVIDSRSGKTRQLTDHKVYDETDPTWSPDGKWIAFISNRTDNPDFTPWGTGLYVMPSGEGEMRKIDAPAGTKILPAFSPDGKWIAYYAFEGENAEYENQGLWVAPVDSSNPPHNLTSQYDIHADAWTINDLGQPEQMPPTWSNDSQSIYFQAVNHGSTILLSLSRDGKNLQTVIPEGGVVANFSFDRSQEKVACFYGMKDDPCQIILRDMLKGETVQLTGFNQALINKIDLGKVEEVFFKGPSNNELQGWIITPPGFDPARKYPSIMEIHGGPLTQYGKFFMHEFYYLAAHGYVVYFCNPRGGRGYGEAHSSAIWGNWGSVDYDDLMAWADYMAAQPYIDANRMGITGGSYGGYMTVWTIGHTQRFKAAVVGRCVSNFISEWGSSDFNWTFQLELRARQPFFDFEKFWSMSPIKYIGNARTPTLVLHNEMDLRCPIEQGEQVFVALKSLGVESEMVRFPDEFHGLSRTGRTDRRIARLNHILRWFDKYLK
jgi:dipeptidyl aminopeptidase/acylaminoacyl peptidase